MNFLVVDIENSVEILETSNCGAAIQESITQVTNGVKAELFVEVDSVWYGWELDQYGFIGTRPKHPPTR